MTGQPMRVVPLSALACRGKSAREVWVEPQNLKLTADWWSGTFYPPPGAEVTIESANHPCLHDE